MAPVAPKRVQGREQKAQPMGPARVPQAGRSRWWPLGGMAPLWRNGWRDVGFTRWSRRSAAIRSRAISGAMTRSSSRETLGELARDLSGDAAGGACPSTARRSRSAIRALKWAINGSAKRSAPGFDVASSVDEA